MITSTKSKKFHIEKFCACDSTDTVGKFTLVIIYIKMVLVRLHDAHHLHVLASGVSFDSNGASDISGEDPPHAVAPHAVGGLEAGALQ